MPTRPTMEKRVWLKSNPVTWGFWGWFIGFILWCWQISRTPQPSNHTVAVGFSTDHHGVLRWENGWRAKSRDLSLNQWISQFGYSNPEKDSVVEFTISVRFYYDLPCFFKAFPSAPPRNCQGTAPRDIPNSLHVKSQCFPEQTPVSGVHDGDIAQLDPECGPWCRTGTIKRSCSCDFRPDTLNIARIHA